MGRIRSAFIEEFGDLMRRIHSMGCCFGHCRGRRPAADSSFVLRMVVIPVTMSRKATDRYEQAYGAARRPDGVVLTPEVLNATVDCGSRPWSIRTL